MHALSTLWDLGGSTQYARNRDNQSIGRVLHEEDNNYHIFVLGKSLLFFNCMAIHFLLRPLDQRFNKLCNQKAWLNVKFVLLIHSLPLFMFYLWTFFNVFLMYEIFLAYKYFLMHFICVDKYLTWPRLVLWGSCPSSQVPLLLWWRALWAVMSETLQLERTNTGTQILPKKEKDSHG